MKRSNELLVIAGVMCLGAPLFAQELPAFPGAEGFGAAATGGRGKPVVEVTNLDDSGPGSFREALSAGDRTIVFRVSGTINLKTRLELNKPNVTIAGQTAPGDGICLRGQELMIKNCNNVIVRYIRSRPGDEAKIETDALGVWNSQKIMIDHCSMSWSTDSVSDVVKGSREVTIQWSIISEPLNRSVHSKGVHGYGTGWGYGSYHHNLIAHCESRSPRLGADPTRGFIDFRNNVVYNWGGGWSYGGENSDIDFVGNYFKPGPSSKQNKALFNAWKSNTRIYITGNVMETNDAITADNSKGVITEGAVWKEPIDLTHVIVPVSFGGAPVKTDSAHDAYKKVLDGAGASLRRDAVDQRIVSDVRDHRGGLINSQTDVGGWPELKSTEAPVDSDHDGMPDDWEKSKQLNPADASDGAKASELGYTNLELYLNSLVAQ